MSQETNLKPALTSEEQLKIENLFIRADYVVNKSFLPQVVLSEAVAECDEKAIENLANHTKFFRINRLVYDKNESNLEKYASLFSAAHVLGANPALLLHSDGEKLELYFGVTNMGQKADPILHALYDILRGNFPGSLGETDEYDDLCLSDKEMNSSFNTWFGDSVGGVAAVSGVPSVRKDAEKANVKFVQGLEKVIDTMRGRAYTAIVMAKNISEAELNDIRAELEMLYTDLSPFAKTVLSYGESSTDSVSKTLSHSISESEGKNWSRTLSTGRTITEGESESDGVTKTNTGGAALILNYSHSKARTHSVTKSTSIAKSTNESSTEGSQITVSTSDSESKGVTVSVGTNTNRQIEYHNKSVEQILKKIDEQLIRIQESSSYGMFGAAAYFLSPDEVAAQTAASAFKSIMSGDKTALEAAQISTWSRTACKQNQTLPTFEAIVSNLRCFRHPVFKLETGELVTPVSLVSAHELALEMGLPKKSVSGVSVIETVPFGRNVRHLSGAATLPTDKVHLGKIHHMWEKEKADVDLDRKSLTGHTFITGSTGAGKSNVIYHLINEITKDGKAHFMVIEPAKGEYKDVFGNRTDVMVYSTNPSKADLLRLNPFSFPEDIHVLEHIDRLVEVFNACWPMYAAMPAVLKDAVEEAYTSCGWSLTKSICVGRKQYPTFADVLQLLPEIMKKSDYSKDTQGDYTGALVTRVKSLTNGINGQIFCSGEEILPADLFDKNVIVDLSRVGSSETKALLMGILMIKLQEHRMSTVTESNTRLSHITVLEEAHNLLRRTSTEQNQEGSNLQGKAVEMLTNAIAEMRTYGEGFIIADQAPGLLDMAVIRNTNTKVILRLPDESDRKLVGKAAGLSDEQIPELAKLDTGVAAVYQNNWLEPVLCKIDLFESGSGKYKFENTQTEYSTNNTALFSAFAAGKKCPENITEEAPDTLKVKSWIEHLPCPVLTKQILLSYISGSSIPEDTVKAVLYSLVNGPELFRTVLLGDSSCTNQLVIDQQIGDKLQVEQEVATVVRQLLCDYIISQSANDKEVCERFGAFRG